MARRFRKRDGVRCWVSTLVFGTAVCSGLLAQTRTAVSGMSRFTDDEFGFSFWYPAAWKVLNEPVADPSRYGWFPNARIVKELQIRNPAPSDDGAEPAGVILQVLLAPEGLTELGRSRSPSPVGVDQKIFFDSETRRWMLETLTESPDGSPPSTSPAKITRKTIGGLPMFLGAVRGGAETIVPLDAIHFLAICSLVDPINDDSHTYLAATLVAANPDAGQHGSEQVQMQAIRQEGIKLGAIGRSLGSWYKDGDHVYNLQGEVIPGADPRTFTPIWHNGMVLFAKDRVHVYTAYGVAIPGADPKTFVATGMLSARDAHHVYDWSSGSLRISNVSGRE